MKIIVCVKQVPDTETRVRIAASGAGIEEDGVNWVVSPYVEFAIEEALRIREAKGGEVVLLGLGPERVQTALRNGLAMGADSAVHLKDPLFDAADTLGVARALAAAIKAIGGFDLVQTGQQGVGSDNGQVPGLLAELLDLPQITFAKSLSIEGRTLRAVRSLEDCFEEVEVDLPALVTVVSEINEPRIPAVTQILKAGRKPKRVLKPEDLGIRVREYAMWGWLRQFWRSLSAAWRWDALVGR